MKPEYPALEAELEKSLRADPDETYVKEVQRSLRAFIAAVEIHMRSGLNADQYVQWRELQKAAENAALATEEVHHLMHKKFPHGADAD